MKIAFTFLFAFILNLLFFPVRMYAQSTTTSSASAEAGLLLKAEEMERALKDMEALKLYQQVLKMNPKHELSLVKCAELCSTIGYRQSSPEKRNDYYKAGKMYAQSALKLNPSGAAPHVAMAIVLGRTALAAPAKEKVAAVKEIKSHAEQALKSEPSNFKALHILGKWHLEVASLNSVERTAIKWFYGGIPQASFKEAIGYFEKTRQLEPNFLLNYLELAKAYQKNDQKEKGIEMLKILLNRPNTSGEDPITKTEANGLLKKWSS